MHRFFILNKQSEPEIRIIPTNDLFHQLKKVIRIRDNEKFICIYENLELECVLDGEEFKVLTSKTFEINKNRKLTLIQGIPTNKKVSMILQKATELDVDEIILWQSKRSTSKIEDFSKKEERLNKIIIEACEQTRRNDIPTLKFIESIEEISFNETSTITLYENEQDSSIKEFINSKQNNNIQIIIGPEGGFEDSEVEYLKNNGSYIATFGKNILRTETAAIAALSIIGYEVK